MPRYRLNLGFTATVKFCIWEENTGEWALTERTALPEAAVYIYVWPFLGFGQMNADAVVNFGFMQKTSARTTLYCA